MCYVPARSILLERHGGVRANTLVILTITVAGLAHELQKERDLLAARLADDG